MADSSLSDIDSTLPNLNELLRRRPTVYPTSTAPVRKPGDRQSNPIEVLNTPPPLHQVAPTTWREVPQAPQAPSTPSWLRRPWYTDVESSAQASAQESFSPLPPSPREHRAASVQDTNNPLPLWLQSPSPEAKIQRLEWQPNPRLHQDLAPVVKKVVDSMPAHHLLEPYEGEIFEDTNAAFDRY